MKHYIFTLLAISSLLCVCASCNKSSTDEVEIFDDGTTQLFVTNVDEQRCPADAVCVWEGFATIEMRIENESDAATFKLSTADGIVIDDETLSMDTTLMNTTITLIALLPIPNTNQVLDIDEYTVDVEVEY